MTRGMNGKQPAASHEVTSVPLLDVGRGNGALREEILAAVSSVCDSGRFLYGPEVTRLEQLVANICQTKHAVGCASGSDALLLALMALDIRPGDEIIVPSFTFFATASAVWRLGATPVFVDIDPQTFNLQPDLVEQAISSETRAIIPVHLFGQCAAMDVLRVVADQYDIPLIEDAAQAIGARYHDRAAGSWGLVGCLSFYPTKNLGGFGDGGMLVTQDEQMADRLRLLAGHGMRPRYYHSEVGINSRLDSIQAAVLEVKIQHLESGNQARAENATRYHQLFTDQKLDRQLTLPAPAPHCHHVWNQYTIRVPDGRRDDLRSWLADRGVGAEVYYPVPLHQQECFQALRYPTGSLPETERAAQEVLSLPIFPELTQQEQQYVVRQIASYYAEKRTKAA